MTPTEAKYVEKLNELIEHYEMKPTELNPKLVMWNMRRDKLYSEIFAFEQEMEKKSKQSKRKYCDCPFPILSTYGDNNIKVCANCNGWIND